MAFLASRPWPVRFLKLVAASCFVMCPGCGALPQKPIIRRELHARAHKDFKLFRQRQAPIGPGNPMLILDETKKPKSKNAVVTHICHDWWVHGALALAASVRASGAKADTVLLLSPSVASVYLPLLGRNFDRVFSARPLVKHPSVTRKDAHCVTLQLRTWQLPYEKALYLDADMIMLKNPDYLFHSYGELSAKLEDGVEGFNGGMFMCQPNPKTYKILTRALQERKGSTKDKGNRGIQPFLNSMFPPCNKSSSKYQDTAGCLRGNFSKVHNHFARELRPEEASALINGGGSYESLHYSGAWWSRTKPWMAGCLNKSSSTTHYADSTQEDVLNIWMNAYRKVKPVEGYEHLLNLACPYFDCSRAQGNLDFVVHVHVMDCVTRSMILSLIRYAEPRRILLLGPHSVCQGSNISRVQCVDQDSVVPGLSRKALKKWLSSRLQSWSKTVFKYKEYVEPLTNLYFQQFLKMGVAEAVGKLGLSKTYVLLDSNMIMIRNFCPVSKTGKSKFMVGGWERPGDVCFESYRKTFEKLTKQRYTFSSRGQPFESFGMLVNTTIMLQLLNSIREQRSAKHWSFNILEAACSRMDTCKCGLSAYSAYPSWAMRTGLVQFDEIPRQYRLLEPSCMGQDRCPDSYTFDGDEDLGKGNQFVKFKRCSSTPGIYDGSLAIL
mmetsp:Transcript_149591/g.259873  ORF Transcript_149591/g.259873 Transcript_149591/m.259873 type:complete len:665 (+) Transcript_149591:44-2038(+)